MATILFPCSIKQSKDSAPLQKQISQAKKRLQNYARSKERAAMIKIFLVFVASVSAQCIVEKKYERIDLPNGKDIRRMQQNSCLQGHVLAEHTSPNIFACFLRCVDNCQCLSFNFNSNVANCELNEAASYTNPESIKPKNAWTYVEMARSYMEEPMKKSCLRNICHNGCCQSSPCENGGTCREVCDVKVRRFVCACPTGYSGHRCHKPLRSCHDILTSGRHKNGMYKIRNATNGTLDVYCDFDSEPGAGWTLVQSYTLEKGQNSSGNDIFSRKPLSHDFAVNETSLGDWSSYRLSLANMQLIRSQSTHWRATCNFPTVGVDFRDYARASFVDINVMKPDGTGDCRRFEFINIRGNQCISCTAFAALYRSKAPMVRTYDHRSEPCDFDGKSNAGKPLDRNFGSYRLNANKAFRCSATKKSTTQYWFGKI